MRRSNELILILVLLAAAGCQQQDLDGPRNYFDANKSGGSADYGIMKNGDDHVVTVHGFMDDLEMCQQIVSAMNATACEETGGTSCLNPFSCQPLNH